MPDFTTFQKAFKGDLVTPDDAGYAEALSRWASNARRHAMIVAFVKGAEDASLAIKYAKEHKLPIAIRGGGHSASGASSSEGGLVLDLSRYLNTVKVDVDKKLAYIGGGSIWETVDKTAIKHGLATVGGAINHTGVGGLVLGGGYGWLSGAHGLAIDNLVQATVVVADGSILTASDTENEDLFWAIRGGGSNFGVCTEFVMKLHPQRRTVFAGMAIFDPDVLEELMSLIGKWWANGPSAEESLVQGCTRGPDGKPVIIMVFFYNGCEADGRANYKAFFDLHPIVDMVKEIPYENLNAVSNDTVVPGLHTYMKGIYQMKPHLDSLREAFERVKHPENKDHQTTILLEYLTLTKINSVPNGATPFCRVPGYNALVYTRWMDDTADNAKYGQDIVHELTGILSKGQTGLAASQPSGYGNYNDFDSEASSIKDGVPSKAERLFGDNYPRMQQIKKKYDPELVFNKWFAVTPAA